MAGLQSLRPGALDATVSCNACWSSASARRDKARHCLFMRMSGLWFITLFPFKH